MMRRRVVSCVIVALCVLASTGCGTPSGSVHSDSTGQYSDAVQLFEKNCISCHGTDLEGGIGPNLQHVGARLTAAEIQLRIDVGGGAMPGFGPTHMHILSNSEIQRLSDWLATKK
jgi:cytochrome c551